MSTIIHPAALIVFKYTKYALNIKTSVDTFLARKTKSKNCKENIIFIIITHHIYK